MSYGMPGTGSTTTLARIYGRPAARPIRSTSRIF
jgi:hypothetical protein